VTPAPYIVLATARHERAFLPNCVNAIHVRMSRNECQADETEMIDGEKDRGTFLSPPRIDGLGKIQKRQTIQFAKDVRMRWHDEKEQSIKRG
jgi:hypothetical protein